jgi:hypothetical protein
MRRKNKEYKVCITIQLKSITIMSDEQEFPELNDFAVEELKKFAAIGYRMKKRSQQYAKKTYLINKEYISWRKKLRLALRKAKAVEEKIQALRGSEPIKHSAKEEVIEEATEEEEEEEIEIKEETP